MELKPPKGGSETILVVDDEKSIRDFATQVLKKYGYTVHTAASGEEALDLFIRSSKEIDLVILDIGMPGMGGNKCLQEMIKLDPSAKVVVASGYSMDGQIMQPLETGALGYISKPYKVADLLNEVRNVLGKAHGRYQK